MPSIMRLVFRFGVRFCVSLKSDDVEVKSLDGHDLLFVFINRRRIVRFSYQADRCDIVGAGVGVDSWRGRSGRMRWETRSQCEQAAHPQQQTVSRQTAVPYMRSFAKSCCSPKQVSQNVKRKFRAKRPMFSLLVLYRSETQILFATFLPTKCNGCAARRYVRRGTECVKKGFRNFIIYIQSTTNHAFDRTVWIAESEFAGEVHVFLSREPLIQEAQRGVVFWANKPIDNSASLIA